MNEKIFFEWSSDTIVTTIIFAIIIIASLLYLYKEYIDTDSRLKEDWSRSRSYLSRCCEYIPYEYDSVICEVQRD